ncbi:hypothetical protein Y032_0123g1135 [Ancylostoma ceylanicum]|nr:hypothetical protein Y032_0123g1135 [Ancylostoma ceylanicum]
MSGRRTAHPVSISLSLPAYHSQPSPQAINDVSDLLDVIKQREDERCAGQALRVEATVHTYFPVGILTQISIKDDFFRIQKAAELLRSQLRAQQL